MPAMRSPRKASSSGYGRDPVAREQLILQHLPLVHHVIGRLAMSLPGVLDREDLAAHGVVGLIQAIDRYDPSQGVPFASWAAIRIRGAVIDAVRALELVNPATRQRVRALREATNQLTANLGRLPTDEELQAVLQLSPAEYDAALEAANAEVVSLDAVAPDADAPLADLLMDESAEDPGERGPLLALVAEALQHLDERERLVLSLYYVEDLTLQEIGEVLHLHKTVIVRIHGRAIVKLRALLAAEEPAHPTPEATDEGLANGTHGQSTSAGRSGDTSGVDSRSGAGGSGPGRRDAGPGGAQLPRRRFQLGGARR
jgi:RNA polymerase sigma factor for flagellar operon FliA